MAKGPFSVFGLMVRRIASNRKALHLLSVLGAVLIWSTSFTATKIALVHIPPLTIGALRFILATVILAAILAAQHAFVKPTRGDACRLLAGGLLGITLYMSLENVGVQFATASDAALIVASYPAITMSLEMMFFRTTVAWSRLVGVGIAMLGVYLVVQGGPQTAGPYRLLGVLILIGTGFVWACYNFVTRSVVKKYRMLTIAFYQMASGSIAFLPLAWTERGLWQTPSPESVLMIVHLGLACSVAAYILYGHGLRGLDASSAVMLMNLVPVFGVGFAVVVLQEPVGIAQLFGGLTVIIGVVLSVNLHAKATTEIIPDE